MWLIGAWYVSLLVGLFLVVCLFMILVILIQRPRGGGLSGAFGGGGGSTQAAFGAKTGDVLTWFTVICFTAFLLLAMGLTWAIQPQTDEELPGVESSTDNTLPNETIVDTEELPTEQATIPSPVTQSHDKVPAEPQNHDHHNHESHDHSAHTTGEDQP